MSGPRPSAARFHPTRWSLILGARGTGEPAQRALGELCASYWYPLYAFARRKGLAGPDAEEAVQSLFASLLERNDLRRVDPARGRFRSFLLAAFEHWLAHERERARAQKRGGGAQLVSIDALEAEERYRLEPADGETPEHVFERAWVAALLAQVLAALREEYAASGRAAIFDGLSDALGADRSAIDARGRAVALDMSEAAVRVALHRLRSRYRAMLRAAVAETVACDTVVDDELAALLGSVSRPRRAPHGP